MAHVSLTANARTEFGNGPARRLRKSGYVPGVVYQPGGPSLALSLSERELRRAIAEGRTGVFDLAVGVGPARPVLLKDWQLHPVRLDVIHVDFVEVDLTQEIEAPVAITLVGDAQGVREGGVMDQTLREVVVSALPDTLPDQIELDVAALQIGDSVTVADLVAPTGVTIVTEPEMLVASIVAPTVEAAPETDEELEGAEPAAPADEGEAGGSDEG
jgi:large subunit ribosomal protein L25